MSLPTPLGRRSTAAFTLIELLVVIVILGILMAVAVPTFLRQQAKAQDSRTQQYLTTAFEAIRTGTPDTGNQYPSSTSIVSWVQQSEPELTVQRASCYRGAATSPVDGVLVDPSSTASSLLLCARSASGNLWELSATATSPPTLINGTLVPLTFSGNEITDSTRASDVQGDGMQNDSSTGIWEGTTNLITNGGFESSTSGWNIVGSYGGVYARDATASKFGAASLEITRASGQSGYVGAETSTWITVTAGQTYTLSAWVRPDDIPPSHIHLEADENGGATYSTTASTFDLADANGWRHLTVTFTVDTGITQMRPEIYNSTSSDVGSLHLDGVQLEQKSLATPYVETNGSSATRNAARVQAPAGLLTSSQGWVAARVRMDAPSSSVPSSSWKVFAWSDGTTNNRIDLSFDHTAVWHVFLKIAGTQYDDPLIPDTFAAGDVRTVVAAWTSTAIGVSVDGSSFAWVAYTGSMPALSASFDIGRRNDTAAAWLDGDIIWFGCGTGTLTDSDAAMINSWGSVDPKRSSFPASAQATMVWNGAGSTGSLK